MAIEIERKFLVTTLLRAFGYKDDKDILALFYQHRELTAKAALELDPEELSQLVYADPIVDVETGKVVAKQYDKLSRETLKEIHKQLPKQKFGVFDTAFDNGSIILSLRNLRRPSRLCSRALAILHLHASS